LQTSPKQERRKAARPRALGPEAGVWALLLLPAVLTVYLSFRAGGVYAGTIGSVALVMALLLLLRITLSPDPFSGVGAGLAITGGALGLYAVWCLLSAEWSGAPARAMIEFDRALLYWLTLIFFGSFARRAQRLDAVIRWLAAGVLVVCAVGLVSRLFPDVIAVSPGVANHRLSYPITYWNGLGLLASLGLIFGLHLASSLYEPVYVRVGAAAGIPVLVATLYFTFSRGAIAAGAIGLLIYLLVARPRGALGGLLAALPPGAVVLHACYGADLLSTYRPTVPRAVEQGHEVALVVAACVVAAVLLRLLALPLDRRLAAIKVTPAGRRFGWGALGLAAMLIVAAFALSGGPGYVERQADRFVEGTEVTREGDLRRRFTDVGANGRVEHWQVALDEFRANPVTGTGAGTYSISWARDRDSSLKVEDAHSLYLETIAELGVVGGALVILAMLGLFGGLALAVRRERLPVYGVLLAVGVTWALEAGLDWVWEMPAITLRLFAFGGMAIARPPSKAVRRPPQRLTRVLLGAGVMALAVTPSLIVVSQHHLDDGTRAFLRGDCAAAIDSSLSSIGVLSARSDPYLLLGFCDARLGEDALAVGAMRRAVSLDPEGWKSHYGLALAQATAGQDPRRAAREAFRLNPRSVLTADIREKFDTNDPEKWKRRARKARLFSSLSN